MIEPASEIANHQFKREGRVDYGKILTRAFEITFKHRALWVFGFLLALFGGRSSGNFNFGNLGGSSGRGTRTPSGDLPMPTFPSMSGMEQAIALVVIALLCFALIWFVLSVIFRLVSRGALIGLVHELERDEKKPTVRRGFSIGAEHFKPLLGIALIVNIPLAFVSFGLVLIAIIPFIISVAPLIGAGRRPPNEIIAIAVTGIAGSVAFFCCIVLILAAIGFIIQPFYEFFVRACVLGKRGARDAIREGYRLVRANLGNVGVLYILLIGIGIAFGILLIPVLLVLIAIVAVAALAVYWLGNSVVAAIVTGVLLGIPAVILLVFIQAIFETFQSVVWTEGYLALVSPPTKPATTQMVAV